MTLRRLHRLLFLLSACGMVPQAVYGEQASVRYVSPFQVAWVQEQVGPAPSVQPEIPFTSNAAAPSSESSRATRPTSTIDSRIADVDIPDLDFGSLEGSNEPLSILPVDRLTTAGGAANGSSNVVLGSEATVRATTDVGDLLGSSLSNLGVYVRQESPIMHQTRVRSLRYDQIRVTSSGAFWFPIRPDMDTPLSRFDSSIVRDVVIIKGPYAVRNGPGLAFIDVALNDSPRYSQSGEWGGLSKFLYNENGDQWYARQSFQGGGPTAGWRIGYGHTGGIDYEAGNGSFIGASHEARDIDFTYGFDVSQDSALEFNYLRSELTNVQLAGQINDLNFLNSDGFSLKYTLRDQERFDLLTVHGWYNKSAFAGDAHQGKSAAAFPFGNDPQFAATLPNIVTEGDNSSLGTRSSVSWFGDDDEQLTVGTDYNRSRQDYRQGDPEINWGVPLSQQDDFGVFSDTTLNATEDIKVRAGSRLDWINSTAREVITGPLGNNGFFPTIDPGAAPDQNFALAAGYITTETILTPVWTGDFGGGYAERAPSATELYAERPSLNIFQQGGRADVLGNNDLNEERMVQIDAGLTGQYEYLQLGLRGYHAWVDDFITLRPSPPNLADIQANNTFGSPRFSNTQARLSGAESYATYSVTDQLSTFTTVSYTYGRDETLNLPLWGIAPLETVLGFRLKGLATAYSPSPWGLEYSVRLVSAQNSINSRTPTATYSELNPLFPRGNGAEQEIATPAFTLHNIRGYYRLNRAISMVAGIENIGDSLYREHLNSIRNISNGTSASNNAPLGGGVFGRGRNIYFGVESRY